MKTFIVFTDFSKNAQHAASYAVQLAMKRGAAIRLVHIFENPVAVSEYEVSTIHFQSMEDRILKELEDRKQELIHQFGPQVPISCHTYNKHLIERMQELFADPEVKLAIIGLTGSGMNNFFLGSNTLDIVQRSGCTVLTVPPYSAFRPIKNIVFACNIMDDLSSTLPVKKLEKITALFDAKLFVLHIVSSGAPKAKLEEKKLKLSHFLQDIPYSFHIENNHNIIAGIKEFSQEIKGDMIAIIPGHHDFWGGLLSVNHTKALLFKSEVPIMSIGEKETD